MNAYSVDEMESSAETPAGEVSTEMIGTNLTVEGER